jgi:hemerythrin
MLLWNEQFATGQATIDGQHQKLFDSINRLEGLVGKTNPTFQDCGFIISLLDYLEDYVVKHFEFEEQCMESYRCPAHRQNREAHQQFIVVFRRLRKQFQFEGFRPEILKQLHEFMEDWIQRHVMQIDVQLKPCLRPSPLA